MNVLSRAALIGLLSIAALTAPAFGQVAGTACVNNQIGTPVFSWSGQTLFGCPPNTLAWTVIAYANQSQTVTVNLTLSQLQNMYTTPVQILGLSGTTGFGAGTLIEMGSCVLDLIRGSAAFTSGGAVYIGYGSTETLIAAAQSNASIASTVFTTFAASQAIAVGESLAVTATSLLLNQPVYITNVAGTFAGGTGGSAILTCNYRIQTGLSYLFPPQTPPSWKGLRFPDFSETVAILRGRSVFALIG